MRFTLLLTLCAAGLLAQSDRGSITGAVSDPASAVVPAAAIVATNAETGARFETITTATGNYTLAQLPAGIYTLEVNAPGFTKYVQKGIRVQVASVDRIDINLQLSSTNDSV